MEENLYIILWLSMIHICITEICGRKYLLAESKITINKSSLNCFETMLLEMQHSLKIIWNLIYLTLITLFGAVLRTHVIILLLLKFHQREIALLVLTNTMNKIYFINNHALIIHCFNINMDTLTNIYHLRLFICSDWFYRSLTLLMIQVKRMFCILQRVWQFKIKHDSIEKILQLKWKLYDMKTEGKNIFGCDFIGC